MSEVPSLAVLLAEVESHLSPRQWRLFACCCVRRLASASRGSSRDAVELAERFADGKATAHQLASVRFSGRFSPGHAAWAVCWDPALQPRDMAYRAMAWSIGHLATGAHLFAFRREEEAQARMLADIAGGVLGRLAIDPLWLSWNDRTIPSLARAIYDEHSWEQMPILADALQDAGCTEPRILEHCRPDGHVRGCWLLDALLGLNGPA